MANLGMLLDYEWCTGCHSCEIACQMEHGFSVGKTGISVLTIGPWEIKPDLWQLDNIAIPTKQCNACVDRLISGKLAACEHHCQAKCLHIGDIDILADSLKEKPRQVLYNLA